MLFSAHSPQPRPQLTEVFFRNMHLPHKHEDIGGRGGGAQRGKEGRGGRGAHVNGVLSERQLEWCGRKGTCERRGAFTLRVRGRGECGAELRDFAACADACVTVAPGWCSPLAAPPPPPPPPCRPTVRGAVARAGRLPAVGRHRLLRTQGGWEAPRQAGQPGLSMCSDWCVCSHRADTRWAAPRTSLLRFFPALQIGADRRLLNDPAIQRLQVGQGLGGRGCAGGALQDDGASAAQVHCTRSCWCFCAVGPRAAHAHAHLCPRAPCVPPPPARPAVVCPAGGGAAPGAPPLHQGSHAVGPAAGWVGGWVQGGLHPPLTTCVRRCR